MNYPIEEITYKMKFIMDKLDNGEELTVDEERYVKKIKYAKSIYDSLSLERQIKEVNIENSEVLRYLVDRRAKLLKTIEVTKSRNKLEKMRAQIDNIEKFIKGGAVEYFKDFLIDHNDVTHVRVMQVFKELAAKDDYLDVTRLEDSKRLEESRVIYTESPFIYENSYTKEVRFNRPLIDLVRTILAGNFKAYNALEKRSRLLKNKGDSVTELEELEAAIPEEFRNINPQDISRIIYYGRGRIGKYDDHTFDNLRDDLEILALMDHALNGEKSQEKSQIINDSIIKVLEGIISGEYKVKEFTNYHILKFFDDNLDTTKFRSILNEYHFDLDRIKKIMLQDDLLSKTKLNSSENMFVDFNGELRLDNISLAASIMNAEEINEDECLSADPKCLDRIKYFQPAHRPNPHEYEKDKYDVKILLAIARYEHDLKIKLEQEQIDKNNKSLL